MSQQTGELVSKQVVLDILEKEGHKWGNDYRDWVDAIEEIKKLPPVTSKEPKWIPVSERLPEEKVEQRIRSFGNAESYCHRCGIKMPESYYSFCFNCGTNLRRY